MKNFLVYLILVLFSCTSSNKEKNNTAFLTNKPLRVIEADPSMGKTVQFSDLYDNVRFIPLETSAGHLVDHVEKITFSKNKFFVLSSKSVLIFDSKGKFISKIDSKGLGPEEYRTLWDMHVDTLNNVIEVLDTPGRKILTFDYKGEVLNVWRHDLIVETFFKMNKNNYLFYCGNNFNLNTSDKLVYASKGPEIVNAGFFKINKNASKYLHFKNNRVFSYHNDSISFLSSFSDTIFIITQEGPKPRLVIDFGNHKLPSKIFEKHYENALMFIREVRKENYAFLINSFFENDDIIFFAFEYGDEARFVYYFKKLGKTRIVSKIEDDMNFNSLAIPNLREYTPKALINGRFLILMEPYIFIERVEQIRQQMSDKEWKRYQERHPDMIHIYNNAEITDNPIICLAKLKKH